MADTKYLTVKQAAKYLTVSVSFLYESDIPYAKLSRRRVYRPEDLDAYVARKVRR